ncbi:DNA-binding protein [Saccharibacillus sp. O23]|uniref:helix-turn-helix domain-containing protein n=1 Tax=Saccharibacillus sp. O23 TaxID=2009338 RepID=UPI000B4DF5BF|nr:XRE family transcriptional regulator [Saccharibacillus sp. O23]OWR32527.1 DNA-binding protein [Saccharibacillus sp. O23]
MEDAIHVRIGQNLQRIRKQRGLSLDKLAALTNVSKGMLHQMERGDIQPTVTTVWKIATGLNISFSSLLRDDDASVVVATPAHLPNVTEDDGRCRIYMLFPFDPQTKMEMFTMVLDAGTDYTSVPHQQGVYEFLNVTDGTLRMDIQGESYTLNAGQAIRFAGHAAHRYINPSATITTVQVTMYYSEQE